MTDDTNEPTIEATWVYMGQRVVGGDKIKNLWCTDNNRDELHAFAKFRPSGGIGGRYVVTIQDGSVFTTGDRGPRFVDRLDEPDTLADWAASERADLVARERRLRAKRETGTSPFDEQCAALRTSYRATIGHVRRAALLAAIIEQVTS